MKRLAFVIPCHGRHAIAGACLRQLARTCAELAGTLEATAVLVSDESFFEELAAELGFAHIWQANRPLGRKWNDGFQHAVLELEVDYAVPLGSDDVIDANLVAADLPDDDAIRCSRQAAVVSEDGATLSRLVITYEGGDGVRVMPAALLRRLGGRPADDSRDRAIDTSMSMRLRAAGIKPRRYYVDLHPLQIVDFKSPAGQLNDYRGCHEAFGVAESDTVWEDLAAVYPAAFVDEISACYPAARTVAA